MSFYVCVHEDTITRRFTLLFVAADYSVCLEHAIAAIRETLKGRDAWPLLSAKEFEAIIDENAGEFVAHHDKWTICDVEYVK